PVSLGDSGGTWAMGGLNRGVPVKPVQAAQSPLNIMQGDCAKFAVESRCPACLRKAAHIAQSALCRRPRLSALLACRRTRLRLLL
ncbi:hypothetical protein FE393_17590, partial [Xenorhabdus sp. psl]|nr:hypothetical protein [Xenorhabdus sp. psl]